MTIGFINSARFPFAKVLEANWRAIRDEYLGVRAHLKAWPERKLYGEGWSVFGLYDFPSGAPIDANILRSPITASLVANNVPRHGAVGFSVLAAGTRISPHQGLQGEFLRCHLGLIIPKGDCSLKVNDEVRGWQEGHAMVFDDRLRHEAWNMTSEERVVLLFDFIPD